MGKRSRRPSPDNPQQPPEDGINVLRRAGQMFEGAKRMLRGITSSRRSFTVALTGGVVGGTAAIFGASQYMASTDDENNAPTSRPAPQLPPLQADIAPISSEQIIIEGYCFTLEGTPEQRATLQKALEGALSDLKEFGFPLIRDQNAQPLSIRMTREIATFGETIFTPPFDIRFYTQEDHDPFDAYPLETESRLSAILVRADLPNPRQTLTHELAHSMLGHLGVETWHEGICEALELIVLGKQNEQATSVDPEHHVILKRLGLERYPWGQQTLCESMSVSETNWVSHWMRTEIGGNVWFPFLKQNPTFLPLLLAAVKKQCGDPQRIIPSEKGMLEIVRRLPDDVKGAFFEWYRGQRFFEKPRPGDHILEAFVDPELTAEGKKLIRLFSAQWVKRQIPGKILALDLQAYYPIKIRAKYRDIQGSVNRTEEEISSHSTMPDGKQGFIAQFDVYPAYFDLEFYDPIQRKWRPILVNRDLPY